MERVELIVKRLQQQIDDHSGFDVMLAFAQMLVTELELLQNNSGNNISVIMSRSPEIVSEVTIRDESSVPILVTKEILDESTKSPVVEVAAITETVIPILEIEDVIEEEVKREEKVEDGTLVETEFENISNQPLTHQEEEHFILDVKEEEEDSFIDFKSFIVPELQLDEIESADTLNLYIQSEEKVAAEVTLEEPVIVQKDRFSFFDEPLRVETTVEEADLLPQTKEYVLDIPDELAIQMGVLPKPPMSASPNDFIFEQYSQIPTLELNEQIASPRIPNHEPHEEEEINNKFKDHKIEVAHLLENTHIKDLKKAITINERYLFINDLFKGDEHLFERSIKHIQSFSILPEATFWIERELKVPLQWSAKDEVVQLFDQLVKRRFS